MPFSGRFWRPGSLKGWRKADEDAVNASTDRTPAASAAPKGGKTETPAADLFALIGGLAVDEAIRDALLAALTAATKSK